MRIMLSQPSLARVGAGAELGNVFQDLKRLNLRIMLERLNERIKLGMMEVRIIKLHRKLLDLKRFD